MGNRASISFARSWRDKGRIKHPLSWRLFCVLPGDVGSWGTVGGKLGTVPLFNLLLRDTGGSSAGPRWEGAGSEKGVQLENGGR